MIEDFVQEVNYVDRKDWRQKGQGSDSSEGESEYTETEPGQSLEVSNPLVDHNKRK